MPDKDVDQRPDIVRIREILMPEFLERFTGWNAEYPETRPLGIKAEWHNLHRKVSKLKEPIWDGKDVSHWREDPRTILMEMIGSAFLAICDLDAAELEKVKQEPDDMVDSDGPATR